MTVTKEEFATLEAAAMYRLQNAAKVYNLPLRDYCERVLQDSVNKAIEWEITRLAYGKELHPNAGVKCDS